MISSIVSNIRYSIRVLRKRPGYTAVALATLALGIGANTAVFSLVNGVLLRPLPYPDADRLVHARERSGTGQTMRAAWPNFADWRERSTSFTALAAYNGPGTSTVLGTGTPLRASTTTISHGFLRTLGAVPALGRDFVADEHQLGADPAVLVSDGFWRTYLGGDPELAGHRLSVLGRDVRIVGVMPAGFDYPPGTEIWSPLELAEQGTSRSAHNYEVIGRLRDGVSIERANADLDAITARFLEDDPSVAEEEWFEEYFPQSALVESLHASLVGTSDRALYILLGASGLLLLIACTNLASTALARGTHRQREIAVRKAIGADSRRVLGLLFTESVTLAIAGAALGLGLAALVLRLVPALAPDVLPAFATVSLDPTVFGFALLVALLTAVLFGVLPSLGLVRTGLTDALRTGGRSGPGRSRAVLWRGLIASEVALALVLLTGSGLLIRSFFAVLAVEPGFDTQNVLLATMSPPGTKYADGDARAPLYQRILEEVEALPGVDVAAWVSSPPLQGISNGMVDVEDGPVPAVSGDYQLVSARYFEAVGVPLLAGRTFDDTERRETEHHVIVSKAFADLAWPGENAVGKRMTSGGMDDYWDEEKWATVIGVVGDVRQRDLTRPASPTYYFPYVQRLSRSWSMTAVVRPERADAPGLGPAVREAVRSLDPDVPVTLSTIEMSVSRVVAERRFSLAVLVGFATIALLLACIGIYGVVAYTVARRTREIGIRIALGARPAAVRRLVRAATLADVAIGGVAGLALSLALTRVMQSLLYEVDPVDPVTFAAVLGVLCATAWLAAMIPALRGSRVDPSIAMRAE